MYSHLKTVPSFYCHELFLHSVNTQCVYSSELQTAKVAFWLSVIHLQNGKES
jgi:hypothetical protein